MLTIRREQQKHIVIVVPFMSNKYPHQRFDHLDHFKVSLHNLHGIRCLS
jgi:hypothetical protein